MIIGNFTHAGDNFTGIIQTLSLRAELVFTPVTGRHDKSPDYRITAGETELGIAWKATSQGGNAYLSVRLDDPSFAAPLYCRLVKTRDGHALMWNRASRRSGDIDE